MFNTIDKNIIKNNKKYDKLEYIIFELDKVHEQILRDINRMSIFFNNIKLTKKNYNFYVKNIKILSYMNQAPFAPIYELFVNLYQNINKNTYIVDGGYDKKINIITTKYDKIYIYIDSMLDIVKIVNNEKQYMQTIKFTQKIKLHSNYNKIKWILFNK